MKAANTAVDNQFYFQMPYTRTYGFDVYQMPYGWKWLKESKI